MSLKHFNSLCTVIIRFITVKYEWSLKDIPRFCRLIYIYIIYFVPDNSVIMFWLWTSLESCSVLHHPPCRLAVSGNLTFLITMYQETICDHTFGLQSSQHSLLVLEEIRQREQWGKMARGRIGCWPELHLSITVIIYWLIYEVCVCRLFLPRREFYVAEVFLVG